MSDLLSILVVVDELAKKWTARSNAIVSCILERFRYVVRKRGRSPAPAQGKFAQKLFAESIIKADECIAAGGATPLPNLYGLKAYAYNLTNDSANAKKFFEEYFIKQMPSKIGSGDYSTFATVLLKFAGSEAQAGVYIDKAVELDSIETNKIAYLKQIAVVYKAQSKFLDAANWYNKILSIKK